MIEKDNLSDRSETPQIVIPGNECIATRDLFATALIRSISLNGKPVRCRGIVPGVAMSVTSNDLQSNTGEDAVYLAADAWERIAPTLVDWLTMPTPPTGITLRLGPIDFEFAWEARHQFAPGALDIVVTHAPAAVATYEKQRKRRPLFEGSQTGEDLVQKQRVEIARRLGEAILATAKTIDQHYDRLPGLVRYRLTGALAAWGKLREVVDTVSVPTMTEGLKTLPLPRLAKYFAVFAKDLLPNGLGTHSIQQVCRLASYSAVWLAFEARNGAFYEPTPPMHRLLDAAYIADDVPIGLVELPADTLCIIPEPAAWARSGGIEAIAIFKRPNSIGFVAWTGPTDAGRNLCMNAIELPIRSPDETIRMLLDNEFRTPTPGDEKDLQLWRGAIDYAIKMLLYLKARDAHVVYDRAYSDAPRHFTGLGKRRRAERVAEIDALYDRHIVGPAVLDATTSAPTPEEAQQREVRGHWRRPHFKMQPHGPNASLRKLVFIGPTIVRPDRLGV